MLGNNLSNAFCVLFNRFMMPLDIFQAKKIISLLFVSIFVTWVDAGLSVAQTIEKDSLVEVIESESAPDTLRYNAHLTLGWEIKSVEPQKALRHTKQALDIALKMGDKERIADATSNTGVIYWQTGNFDMAMDYHLDANRIYTNIQDEAGIAKSFSNIGVIFSDQSHYDKALEYFFKALILHEQNNDTRGMAVLLNNIGMVYEHQQSYELAERYHLRSLELKQNLDNQKGIAFSYSNLGLVYQGLKDYEKAMRFFVQSLEIREDLNDKREIAASARNIGYLHLLDNRFDESEEYLQYALNLFKEVEDKSGLAITFNYMGQLFLKKDQPLTAREYFLRSADIAEEIGLNRMINENYTNLAKAMADLNDYQSAFDYQNKYIALKDSLYGEETRRKIYELQLLYDREKKENEIQILRKNEQISQLSSQRDRLMKNFLVIAIILVLISLFLLYNRFLIARNANVLLEKQKKEISETNSQLVELNHSLLEQKKMYEDLNQKINHSNKKLKDSEKNLREINATKDKFFSIISHDLRNPFASIVSFSRILKRDILNMSKEELQQLAFELDKSVLKIDNLLENLLQWSRTQTGKIKYKPEYIALHEIIKENLNLFKNNARDKEIYLHDEVDDNLVVWADKNMADTVIRNLLSNALKYTNINGKIVISSYGKDHKAFVSVKDNGVGMTEENKKKIFRTDSLHSTYGTMEEKGSGLGLLLCKEFVEKQGGEITFASERNKGSEFIFSLPVEPSEIADIHDG